MKKNVIVFGFLFLTLTASASVKEYAHLERNAISIEEFERRLNAGEPIDQDEDFINRYNLPFNVGAFGVLPGQGLRLFSANGVHICQSQTSIGHACPVSGVNYTDCNVAYFSLKTQDCCSRSQFGGNSINFMIQKCSNLF